MLTAWTELAAALAICVALGALGLALLHMLLVRVDALDGLALAFPLGAGVLTWFLFLVSWLGFRLSGLAVGLVWGTVLAAALLVRWRTGSFPRVAPHRQTPDRQPTQLTPAALVGVLLALLTATGFAAWLGISRSYSGWDDMAIWGVKGFAIAREGSIWAAGHWGDHGLAYPLNVPLLIAVLRLTGDALPASKLVFALFYLSLAAGCLRFWLQRGVAALIAVLGAFWLALTPIVFEHATLGYANLPYTFFLVAACVEAVQGFLTGNSRRLALSGVLLGLAAWTRPEGTLAAASIVAAVLVALRLARVGKVRVAAWLLPVLLMAGAWQAFVASQGVTGQIGHALQLAIDAGARGELHLGAVYSTVRFMARQSFEWSVWGLLIPACAVLLILRVRRLRPRSNPDAFLLAVMCAAVLVGVSVQFYLADFLGQLMNYLGNSANRMYMPGVVLVVLLTILLTRSPAGNGLPAAVQMPIGPVTDVSGGEAC